MTTVAELQMAGMNVFAQRSNFREKFREYHSCFSNLDQKAFSQGVPLRRTGISMQRAYFTESIMPDVINLRQARKAKARAEAEQIAAQNRARHGQSKAQKLKARKEQDALQQKLEGAKRDTD
jgi:Domain of unknown function (DUF4169)